MKVDQMFCEPLPARPTVRWYTGMRALGIAHAEKMPGRACRQSSKRRIVCRLNKQRPKDATWGRRRTAKEDEDPRFMDGKDAQTLRCARIDKCTGSKKLAEPCSKALADACEPCFTRLMARAV
jgi:hypothetical protein